MKKYILPLLLVVILAVFCAGALVACTHDDGGVEKLSIESANIFLSPDDTYQLNIDVHPLNAQINTALTYYVPSQYTQYLKVSSTGLITAIENTPEGVVVPIRVTSTTNKKATLTVNVVVESVPVQRIFFNLPETVTLQMGESGMDLEPVFEPSHASDGRTVSYESLNPDIISVNASGHVTPLKGGRGSIKASSRSSTGATVSTRVNFLVLYSAGSYRLETSDRNPQYSQVLGKPKAINFRLMILNPNADPDVTIYWYVGTERVPAADNQIQFVHTPDVQTCTTYRVYAKVKTQNEEEQVFASEQITIHNPFLGFTLQCENTASSRRSYRYGESATFELLKGSDSIKTYDWYLKRRNEEGSGVCVATTVATSRNLTKRMNLDGEFVLTALGKDEKGTVLSSTEYEFGVTKFATGDALVFTPVLEKDGLPPESYNFYIYSCNAYGEKISEARQIGACLKDQSFYYVPKQAGYYKITCQAVLDGIVATVDRDVLDSDGNVIDTRSEPFTYETGLFIIGKTEGLQADDILGEAKDFDEYRAKETTDICDVNVKGITYSGSNRIYLSWRNVRRSPSYVVELTATDGKVFLFDSDEKSDAVFGDNYVILPVSAALNDSFAIRIRHKGYLFSDSYYYGYVAPEDGQENYFDFVPSHAYEFLKPIDGTVNAYLLNMEDLGAVLNYIILNRPRNNGSVPHSIQNVNGVNYDAYTVNVYFAFEPEEVIDKYPSDADLTDYADPATLSVCKAVLGAQNVFCPAGYYRYLFKANAVGCEITVLMTDEGETKTTAPSSVETGTSLNYSQTPYGADNKNFYINSRSSVSVTSVEKLYYALANGNCPKPSGNDAVLILYNRILGVVNAVIGAEMDDYQKVLAFYDYLTANVVYDSDLAELAESGDDDLYDYAGFTLEGVFFYKKAVCDGISKAFVALCAIEGIPAVRVTCNVNGAKHAYNKVLIDDVWYVVDATNGSIINDGALYTDHRFFLISDETYKNTFDEVVEYGVPPTCTSDFDYFDKTTVNGFKLYITSREELDSVLSYLDGETAACVELKFDPDYANGAQVPEEIRQFEPEIGEITNIISLPNGRAIVKFN